MFYFEALHSRVVYRIKEAAIEYHLGVNYVYTEEVSAGQEKLNKVLEVSHIV